MVQEHPLECGRVARVEGREGASLTMANAKPPHGLAASSFLPSCQRLTAIYP